MPERKNKHRPQKGEYHRCLGGIPAGDAINILKLINDELITQQVKTNVFVRPLFNGAAISGLSLTESLNVLCLPKIHRDALLCAPSMQSGGAYARTPRTACVQ